MRPFDAVIFDFGGVVVSSPFSVMAAMGEAGGHSRDEILDLMIGPYDEDTDHPWHRVERGELAIAEFGAWLAEESERRGITLERPEGGTFAQMTVHEPVVAAIRSLRDDGYRTGLLTNNAKEAAGVWRPMVPLDELFDDVVDSCEVGIRKPDPRIYRLACSRLGVEPERTVFLDDAPGNVAGAAAVGMTGVLVEEDPAGALAELRRVLGGSPGPGPATT